MLFWIIQQIIISVVLIISIHYIYVFFKQNLTIPQNKRFSKKRPAEQYKKIYTSLKKEEENKDNMKDELKNYLKQLTKKKEKKR